MDCALEHWREWKAKCALDRCAPAAREALREFAVRRFRRCLSRGNLPDYAPDAETDAPHAWHLFETHLLTAATRQGKRYKDWLFERGAGAEADLARAIEGGAALILRGVVREYLRQEWSPPHVLSLQTVLGSDGGSLTLEDLLPGDWDTAEDVCRRELEDLARREAQKFFRRCRRPERIALLARTLQVSLAHPAATAAAGCRKTLLFSSLNRLADTVKSGLLQRYAAEDPAVVRRLALAVFEALSALVFRWGRAEKSAAGLFREAGGRPEPVRRRRHKA